MIHLHSHSLEASSPATEPNLDKPETPIKPFDRYLSLLDYRIHIGWFGGIHIYSIAENHEHR
ncbi:MAG: hypothetical protein ACFBSF_11900 [Leptolyngbyaceae cyanobacterium]